MGRDESMGRRAGAARYGALRPARMNEHKHGHAGGGGGFSRICLVRAGDLNMLFPAGEVGGVEPVEDGGGGGGAGAGEKAGRWCLIGVVFKRFGVLNSLYRLGFCEGCVVCTAQ